MKNSVSFQINDHLKNKDAIYKKNWPKCGNFNSSDVRMGGGKYITFTSTCKVEPEGYVPEKIIIEYTPWLTMD